MTQNPRTQAQYDRPHDDGTFVVSETEAADEFEIKRSVEDVRQGHTGDHMRYVLLISMGAAALILLILAFVTL